jgi:hypothetical protein
VFAFLRTSSNGSINSNTFSKPFVHHEAYQHSSFDLRTTVVEFGVNAHGENALAALAMFDGFVPADTLIFAQAFTGPASEVKFEMLLRELNSFGCRLCGIPKDRYGDIFDDYCGRGRSFCFLRFYYHCPVEHQDGGYSVWRNIENPSITRRTLIWSSALHGRSR